MVPTEAAIYAETKRQIASWFEQMETQRYPNEADIALLRAYAKLLEVTKA